MLDTGNYPHRLCTRFLRAVFWLLITSDWQLLALSERSSHCTLPKYMYTYIANWPFRHGSIFQTFNNMIRQTSVTALKSTSEYCRRYDRMEAPRAYIPNVFLSQCGWVFLRSVCKRVIERFRKPTDTIIRTATRNELSVGIVLSRI